MTSKILEPNANSLFCKNNSYYGGINWIMSEYFKRKTIQFVFSGIQLNNLSGFIQNSQKIEIRMSSLYEQYYTGYIYMFLNGTTR